MERKKKTAVYYAGFWRRVGAHILDVLISCVPQWILIKIWEEWGNPIMGGVMTVVMLWFYFALFESSSKQATPGKMAFHIIVTDLNGNRISLGRASGRFWAKLVSGLTIGIGYLMAGFTQKKQALHDMIAGTLVVKKE